MATPASEGDELPLVDAPPSGGRALGAKAAAAALVTLAALAPAAALAAGAAATHGAAGGAPGRRELRRGAAEAPPCEDTPNWTNGYWECGGNVHAGPNCEGRGLTCEAYAASGWCQRGTVTPGFEKAFGQGMAWPELNCCACGGGSRLRSEAEVPQVADGGGGRRRRPDARQGGARRRRRRRRRPDARQGCVDTPGWTDGNWECNTWKSKPSGCTPRGLTCGAYQAGKLCVDGAPAPGKEFAAGEEYLYPEKNCCACGGGYNASGGPDAPTAVA